MKIEKLEIKHWDEQPKIKNKINEIIDYLSTQNEKEETEDENRNKKCKVGHENIAQCIMCNCPKEETKSLTDKSYQQGKEDAVRQMYEFAKTAESEIYATRTRLAIKEYAKLNNINLE